MGRVIKIVNYGEVPFKHIAENAVCLYLSEQNSPALTSDIRAMSDFVRASAGHKLTGLLDVIPANQNITFIYDINEVGYKAFVACLAELLGEWQSASDEATSRINGRAVVELPVFYGGQWALDITDIAKQLQCTVADIISWHGQSEFYVSAVGFAPGFAYLEGLHKALHLPRKATPRKHIVAGSVAIAGAQSAVYPCDSPAGWHVLGHCPIPMFSLAAAERGDFPNKLALGDAVRFVAISADEHALLLQQQNSN